MDADCGQSVSEGEIVEDQRRSAFEATIAEGHAASLHVAATVPMITH